MQKTPNFSGVIAPVLTPFGEDGGPDAERFVEHCQWLMWQMGGVGPMIGQVHHFLRNAKGKAPYAEERYSKEAHRLYGVLDKRLSEAEYMAGAYSIADMATWPWISRFEWHQVDIAKYANVLRWYKAIAARPAVLKGYHIPVKQPGIPMPA